jgi:hypothetical protein
MADERVCLVYGNGRAVTRRGRGEERTGQGRTGEDRA